MENLGIIIALLGGVIGLMAVIIALFLWNRSEAKRDWERSDIADKQLRRDMIEIMRQGKEDWKEFRERWAEESKDFHGRLCAIEERRLKEK